MTLGGRSQVACEQAAPRRAGSSAFGLTVQPGGFSSAGCLANPADIFQRDINKGGLERQRELRRHWGRSQSIPEEGDSAVCRILLCFFLFSPATERCLKLRQPVPGLQRVALRPPCRSPGSPLPTSTRASSLAPAWHF